MAGKLRSAGGRDSALTPEQRKLVAWGMPLVEASIDEIIRGKRDLVTEEELLGPGVIALHEAALAYREDGHPSFLHYARYHVRGRLLDAIRTEHFSLRARVEHAMDRAFARMTSHQTLEVDLFMDEEEKLVEGAALGCADALAASFVAAVLEAQQASVEEMGIDREGYVTAREMLREAIEKLHAHERVVVSYVYEKGMTLDEVGHAIGTSAKTAQRRHVSALRKLRAALVARGVSHAPRPLDLERERPP